MAFDYVELGNISADLLKEFGQILAIKRIAEKHYDPASGNNEIVTENYSGYGCAFNYSTNEIDGTRIQTGDMVILLEKTPVMPMIGDIVKLDSVEMRVINVERICPAGIDVLYKLQVRE